MIREDQLSGLERAVNQCILQIAALSKLNNAQLRALYESGKLRDIAQEYSYSIHILQDHREDYFKLWENHLFSLQFTGWQVPIKFGQRSKEAKKTGKKSPKAVAKEEEIGDNNGSRVVLINPKIPGKNVYNVVTYLWDKSFTTQEILEYIPRLGHFSVNKGNILKGIELPQSINKGDLEGKLKTGRFEELSQYLKTLSPKITYDILSKLTFEIPAYEFRNGFKWRQEPAPLEKYATNFEAIKTKLASKKTSFDRFAELWYNSVEEHDLHALSEWMNSIDINIRMPYGPTLGLYTNDSAEGKFSYQSFIFQHFLTGERIVLDKFVAINPEINFELFNDFLNYYSGETNISIRNNAITGIENSFRFENPTDNNEFIYGFIIKDNFYILSIKDAKPRYVKEEVVNTELLDNSICQIIDAISNETYTMRGDFSLVACPSFYFPVSTKRLRENDVSQFESISDLFLDKGVKGSLKFSRNSGFDYHGYNHKSRLEYLSDANLHVLVDFSLGSDFRGYHDIQLFLDFLFNTGELQGRTEYGEWNATLGWRNVGEFNQEKYNDYSEKDIEFWENVMTGEFDIFAMVRQNILKDYIREARDEHRVYFKTGIFPNMPAFGRFNLILENYEIFLNDFYSDVQTLEPTEAEMLGTLKHEVMSHILAYLENASTIDLTERIERSSEMVKNVYTSNSAFRKKGYNDALLLSAPSKHEYLSALKKAYQNSLLPIFSSDNPYLKTIAFRLLQEKECVIPFGDTYIFENADFYCIDGTEIYLHSDCYRTNGAVPYKTFLKRYNEPRHFTNLSIDQGLKAEMKECADSIALLLTQART